MDPAVGIKGWRRWYKRRVVGSNWASPQSHHPQICCFRKPLSGCAIAQECIAISNHPSHSLTPCHQFDYIYISSLTIRICSRRTRTKCVVDDHGNYFRAISTWTNFNSFPKNLFVRLSDVFGLSNCFWRKSELIIPSPWFPLAYKQTWKFVERKIHLNAGCIYLY